MKDRYKIDKNISDSVVDLSNSIDLSNLKLFGL